MKDVLAEIDEKIKIFENRVGNGLINAAYICGLRMAQKIIEKREKK